MNFIVRKMCSARQIFDSLPGIWRLTRETLTPLKQWQNSGAECIKAKGFAAFTLIESDPEQLIYSEKVTIYNENDNENVMNGMQAKQKYKYRYDNKTNTLTKLFFDDRLFYEMKFDARNDVGSTTEATAITGCGTHLCIQDLYEANYSFRTDKLFELKYTVNGPKKCYEIITKYEKCSPDEIEQLNDIEIVNGEIL